MSRRYQEQIEVRVGPAGEHGVRLAAALPVVTSEPGDPQVPTLFLWRGRVHLVRAVLAQWSQRVPWWRLEGAVGDEHEGAGGDADDPGATGCRLERRVWRVEAGAGRSRGAGVYDLVQDGQWWLERVAD